MRRAALVLPAAGVATAAGVWWWRRTQAPAASGGGLSAVRRAHRNRQVASLGARLGTSTAVHRVRRRGLDQAERDRLDQCYQEASARLVTETLGEMKGALMKLGQMASYLDEGLPPIVRDTLAQLQSDAPPMDADTAVMMVERELGQRLEAAFAHFDERPLAAASIGQVHRAVTRDGDLVAVKVQYPGIAEAIRADLDNTDLVGRVLALLFPSLDPGPLAAELRTRIGEELDYRREATEQSRFRSYYAGHPTIRVPAVYPELSTGRILTTELVRGARFDEVDTWSADARNQAAETIYRFVFRSLYRLQAFNGDPHPGNYLFGPDGEVTFLDFGLVRHFDDAEVGAFGGLVRAMVVDRDPAGFRRLAVDSGLLVPDAPFDDAQVVDWFRHFYEIVEEDRVVTLDPDQAAATVRHTFDAKANEILRYANVPPSFALIQRINLGVNALLARLGATMNFRRIVEEIWPWAQGPPSTPLGVAEAEWLARRHPAAS